MVTDNDVARRSGRVTHQTSRRSFSSRLFSPLLSPLLSPPLFHSFLASLSFGFFLRIVPTASPPLWTRTAVFEGSIIRGISSILIEIEHIDPKNGSRTKKESILSSFLLHRAYHDCLHLSSRDCFKNPIEIPLSFRRIIGSLPFSRRLK